MQSISFNYIKIFKMLENYKDLVSMTATIVTIIQFCSGIEICQRIKKLGKTGEISGFPFVGGVFATRLVNQNLVSLKFNIIDCFFSAWLMYGYTLGDKPMIVTNVVGFMLQVLFYGYKICLCD